jgi:hypothetical protein
MRVLVVGTVPPPGGAPARGLAAAAAELRAEGHEVQLLSPDPRSAAHRHARLDGPLLPLWLAYLAPRFDGIYLRFEPGFPLRPKAGRVMRALTLSLIGRALKRYKETTIRFDGGPSIPSGLGGRAMGSIWATTDRIVVTSEDKQAELVEVSGLPVSQVVIASPPATRVVAERESWPVDEDEEESRIRVLELIRARAATARAADHVRQTVGQPSEPASPASLAGELPQRSAPGVAREAVGVARAIVERFRPD